VISVRWWKSRPFVVVVDVGMVVVVVSSVREQPFSSLSHFHQNDCLSLFHFEKIW